MKLKKGCKILKRILNVPPKYALPDVASEYRVKSQNRPMTFPNVKRHSFLFSFPFSPKVRETKRKLKIRSIAVDSTLIKVKEAIRHNVIISRKKPATKRLIPRFICRPIPFPLNNTAL